MSKQKLNGHFDECLNETMTLLHVDGVKESEIKERCIKDALSAGYSPDQVIEMITVSTHFRNYYLTSVSSAPKKGKDVSVCLIRKFVHQFFDDEFDSDQLTDALDRLFRVAYRDYKELGVKHGVHLSTIISRAIEIAEENELHDMEEFVQWIEGRNSSRLLNQADPLSELSCCESELRMGGKRRPRLSMDQVDPRVELVVYQ